MAVWSLMLPLSAAVLRVLLQDIILLKPEKGSRFLNANSPSAAVFGAAA
jgi:hypothetical protein